MTRILSSDARVRLAGIAVLLLASGATIWAGLRNRPIPESPPSTPAETLAALKAGNERFRKSQRTQSTSTRGDAERRKELAKGEKPIAAVVSCADSRVVPEFVFDQAFGRLLTVRDGEPNAAELLGEAVERLRAVLAQQAAARQQLAEVLGEAVERLHLPLIVVLSTDEQARALAGSYVRNSAPLRAALRNKQAALVVAVYNLETGQVEWSEFDPDAEK